MRPTCVRRVAPWIACTAIACGNESTSPGTPTFHGDFTLVAADDWVAKQACNYVIPTDETVCDWGHPSITTDPAAISVRGFTVYHAGVIVHQDSVTYHAPVHVVDACTIAIDSTGGVTPNGRGVLAGDTLHFYGHGSLGDSLSWGYLVVQVERVSGCP